MDRFQDKDYLTKDEKHQLSMSLNTTAKRIAAWYYKMRAKNVAKGLPNQCELCSVNVL